MTATLPKLSPEEAKRFRRDGYIGPFQALTPDEMAKIRPQVEEVLEADPPFSHPKWSRQVARIHCRHQDSRLIYDLSINPEIIGRMRSILDEDILIWRTRFFLKPPGGKSAPWHQDIHYWPLEPPVNASAWIAIDAATKENGCVQLVPGSHKSPAPHSRPEPSMEASEEFTMAVDPSFIDQSQVVHMELEPGQFFLFSERLLHFSPVNRSDKSRLGLAVRFTVPFVEVDHARIFPGHQVFLVSGQDRMGANDLAPGPPRA